MADVDFEDRVEQVVRGVQMFNRLSNAMHEKRKAVSLFATVTSTVDEVHNAKEVALRIREERVRQEDVQYLMSKARSQVPRLAKIAYEKWAQKRIEKMRGK